MSDYLNILMLDIETTGLNPNSDLILEIAAIPVQINAKKIEVGEAYEAVIHHPTREFASKMNNKVFKMHSESGLTKDVIASTKSLQEVDTELSALIKENFGVATKQVRLGGSSVFFDKSFIDVQMPKLTRLLHYRCLDISPFYELKSLFQSKRFSIPAHRAMSDIKFSLELLKEFYGVVQGQLHEV